MSHTAEYPVALLGGLENALMRAKILPSVDIIGRNEFIARLEAYYCVGVTERGQDATPLAVQILLPSGFTLEFSYQSGDIPPDEESYRLRWRGFFEGHIRRYTFRPWLEESAGIRGQISEEDELRLCSGVLGRWAEPITIQVPRGIRLPDKVSDRVVRYPVRELILDSNEVGLALCLLSEKQADLQTLAGSVDLDSMAARSK